MNGHHYNKGYYLADAIYPKWSTLVKTIPNPQGEKRQRFAQMQESARKDVERVFSVLQLSLVFARLAEGHSLEVNFKINGHRYNKGYYLADNLYPRWSTLVKTIPNPRGEKRQIFAQMQESARKDVERAFGVLQSR